MKPQCRIMHPLPQPIAGTQHRCEASLKQPRMVHHHTWLSWAPDLRLCSSSPSRARSAAVTKVLSSTSGRCPPSALGSRASGWGCGFVLAGAPPSEAAAGFLTGLGRRASFSVCMTGSMSMVAFPCSPECLLDLRVHLRKPLCGLLSSCQTPEKVSASLLPSLMRRQC